MTETIADAPAMLRFECTTCQHQGCTFCSNCGQRCWIAAEIDRLIQRNAELEADKRRLSDALKGLDSGNRTPITPAGSAQQPAP